jgi:hypothetical protein
MIQHFLFSVLIVVSYVNCALDSSCSNAQISKTPQKFGILTTTYKRLMMANPN